VEHTTQHSDDAVSILQLLRRVIHVCLMQSRYAMLVQDALTTLRFHGKPLPGRFDDALLDGIEREAARRMLAMIAPADGDAGEKAGMLRLGVGRLAGEIVQRMDAAIAGVAHVISFTGPFLSISHKPSRPPGVPDRAAHGQRHRRRCFRVFFR